MSRLTDESAMLWQEAIYHYDLGMYPKAKDRFLEFLADHPDDGMTMYFIASCAFHLEEIMLAERYVRQAMKHVADRERTHALLGAILMEQGKYVEAEEQLLAALSHHPHNAGIIAQYGYLLLKTGYEEKARELLQEALRLGPADGTVLHYLYFFQRAYDEQTDQTMSDYIQIAGHDVEKLMKLGLSALDKGAYQEARDCFVQAYLLDPTDGQLLLVIEEVDRLLHPIYWPIRMLQKAGGSSLWWIAVFLGLFALLELGYDTPAIIVGIFGILLFVYTSSLPYLYTWSCKIGRRGGSS